MGQKNLADLFYTRKRIENAEKKCNLKNKIIWKEVILVILELVTPENKNFWAYCSNSGKCLDKNTDKAVSLDILQYYGFNK